VPRKCRRPPPAGAATPERVLHRYWALALLVVASALPCAGLASDSNPRPQAAPRSDGQASRTAEADAHAASGEPNFIVIPIRTELQRELVANGKPIDAVVELNGYALAGKRGEDLMRAMDATSLRKSLAAIKTSDRKASIVFVTAYFGEVPPETREQAQKGQNTLEQACRSLAQKAQVRVDRIYSTMSNGFVSDPWNRMVAMLRDIDRKKETATESPVGDRDSSAFPVRTKVTRLLTAGFNNLPIQSADCVLYLRKPLDANDHPMLSSDLAARIKQAVSKLDLSGHDRIDYHLIPADHDRQAYLRNRQAIMDRFYPNEAPQLTKQLGFKNYSVTE
jgi:hypothetical protein